MKNVSTLNLASLAQELSGAWGRSVLGDVGGVKLKLFRTDGQGLDPEVHEDWAEALLMVEGDLTLVLDGEDVRLSAGDLQLIPAGCVHAIRPGAKAAFLLFDPEP
ncbi:cupin domain-containing protein [Phenylobacterium terrae]|uniref:Cupin domain-containing protein n=1 Tax=Phenylobacterium terrae TaxID=2665495 RepID=A0ABW4MZE2_9CAUL